MLTNVFKSCNVEFFSNRWWIVYPDGSKAYPLGYKKKSAAMRSLDYFMRGN